MVGFLKLNKNSIKSKEKIKENKDKKSNDNEVLANLRTSVSQVQKESLLKELESRNVLRSNQASNIVKQNLISKTSVRIPNQVASASNAVISNNISTQVNKLPVRNNIQVLVPKINNNLNNISNNNIASNTGKPVPKQPTLSLNNNVNSPQVVNMAAVNILKIVNNASKSVSTNNVVTAQPPTSANNIARNEDQSVEANINRYTPEQLDQMQLEYAIKMSEETYNNEEQVRKNNEESLKKLESNIVRIIQINFNRVIKENMLDLTIKMLKGIKKEKRNKLFFCRELITVIRFSLKSFYLIYLLNKII